MKLFLLLILFFIPLNPITSEQIFNGVNITNFYIGPSSESSIIYPLELGHEMSVKKTEDEWIQVLDEQTGLVGWVLKKDFLTERPDEKLNKKDYSAIFMEFKERVLEMSKACLLYTSPSPRDV